MIKFEYLKEIIAVFLSNAISDHEMSFEIKHTIKVFQAQIGKIIILGSNWENLKNIELQPNLPVSL